MTIHLYLEFHSYPGSWGVMSRNPFEKVHEMSSSDTQGLIVESEESQTGKNGANGSSQQRAKTSQLSFMC